MKPKLPIPPTTVRHIFPPKCVRARFGPVVHNLELTTFSAHLHFPYRLEGVRVSPITSILSVSHLPRAVLGRYQAIVTEVKAGEMFGEVCLIALFVMGIDIFKEQPRFRPFHRRPIFRGYEQNYDALKALVLDRLKRKAPLEVGQIWRHRDRVYELIQVRLSGKEYALGLAPRGKGLPWVTQQAFKPPSLLALIRSQST